MNTVGLLQLIKKIFVNMGVKLYMIDNYRELVQNKARRTSLIHNLAIELLQKKTSSHKSRLTTFLRKKGLESRMVFMHNDIRRN